MPNSISQITFPRHVIYHFYVGIFITLFYVGVSPICIAAGLPGLAVLLLAELMILLPLVFGHLMYSAKRSTHRFLITSILPYTHRIPPGVFLAWTLGGILASIILYVPLYPLGLYLRATLFYWLPEWYFNPSYGATDVGVMTNIYLIAMVIDGVLGPVAEELFFRGYLLPRMTYLKNWAPIVNGSLFGLYHIWQPHNWIALMGLGIVLSFVVWKTRNVYVAIAIHCTLNILGALGGYLAASGGELIGR